MMNNMPRSCGKDNCCRASRSRNGDALQSLPIGMAYVPWQQLRSLYEPDQALQIGTVFPELCKPFMGRKGCMK